MKIRLFLSLSWRRFRFRVRLRLGTGRQGSKQLPRLPTEDKPEPMDGQGLHANGKPLAMRAGHPRSVLPMHP